MYLYPPDVESSGEISSLVQDKLNPQVSSPSPSCPSIFFLSFSPVSGVWGTCTCLLLSFFLLISHLKTCMYRFPLAICVCLSGLWLGGLLYLSFSSVYLKLVCYAHLYTCISMYMYVVYISALCKP